MGPDAMIFVFWMLSFKPTFSLSTFTFIKRLFSSSSLFAIRVVSSAYLRLLILLPAILIPACASSSPAFLMMYSAYKLNKQGDDIQPWRTTFPIWNQSVVPCPVLTVASWPAYRFLKRQVRWPGIPTLEDFSTVCCDPHSQSLWCSQLSRSICFSGTLLLFPWSSGCWQFDLWFLFFSKTSLNIWNFTVHILLKPGLENFFFFFWIYFNWRLITLQYCGGFCHTLTWISHGCTCVPHPEPPSLLRPHPIPQRSPSALALSALSHALNLDWSSISQMVIYMFQCYSLKSSHRHLLPQSPKDCPLHLCLFCCIVYRVIVTIFLNSIYMH